MNWGALYVAVFHATMVVGFYILGRNSRLTELYVWKCRYELQKKGGDTVVEEFNASLKPGLARRVREESPE